MFPIRDSERSRSTPWITRSIALFTCAAFLFQWMLPEDELQRLVETCGLVPAVWSADPLSIDSFWPLVSSMFLHGSLLHVVSNVWALWIFGDNVEDFLGSTRFLLFYVACGLIAGALHALSAMDSLVPTIGASGAIAGVMGAYFLLHPRARVVTVIPILCFPLILELPAFTYLGLWFVIQLISGAQALVSTGASGGIAWWAHIGGFLAGMALTAAFRRFTRHASDVREQR